MGQIRTEEGIVYAARRVAMEQVGANIEPVGVPLCEGPCSVWVQRSS